MIIERIALDHVRSWSELVLDFSQGINVLYGANGLGKTNILEALEVVATGSSHRTNNTQTMIEFGYSQATIRVNTRDSVQHEPADDVVRTYEVTLRARGANRVRVNQGASQYLRQISGEIPTVLFSPQDQALVTGQPAVRRSFLDQACGLLIPHYAQHVQDYQKVAKQRAALLHSLQERDAYADQRQANLEGLEIWTGQLITHGLFISRARQQIITLLNKHIASQYADIVKRSGSPLTTHQQNHGEQERSENQAIACIQYVPSFVEMNETEEDTDAAQRIATHFQRLYAGEVARGANLLGPHRDDMAIVLHAVPAKEFASNGENWSLALAITTALVQVIKEQRGLEPILMLDDVFAQLDDQRRACIMDLAKQHQQVIITAATKTDIPECENAHLIDIGRIVEQREGNQPDFLSHYGELDDETMALLNQVSTSRQLVASEKQDNVCQGNVNL